MKEGVCKSCGTLMENEGIVHVAKKPKNLGNNPWELVIVRLDERD